MEERPPESLRIGDFKPAQLWGALAAICSALVAAFAFGRFTAPTTKVDASEIVAAFYASHRSEFIESGAADRHAYVDTEPGGGTLVLLLDSEPIPGSVRIRFGAAVVNAWEFEVLRSAVLVATNATSQSYRHSFEKSGATIGYVPSPTASPPEKLRHTGTKLYLGSTLLHDGDRTLWPSGGLGPHEHYSPHLLKSAEKSKE